MANPTTGFGLRSIARTLEGGMPRCEEFQKVVGYGTAIFIGDAVNRAAAGVSIEVSATPGTSNYSGVALNHGAASTATTHLVITSPTALFDVRANGTTVAADEGLLANLALSAGSATTQLSGHVLDSSTQAVTATLDLKIQRINPDALNEQANANARCIVNINKHRNNHGVVGI